MCMQLVVASTPALRTASPSITCNACGKDGGEQRDQALGSGWAHVFDFRHILNDNS